MSKAIEFMLMLNIIFIVLMGGFKFMEKIIIDENQFF